MKKKIAVMAIALGALAVALPTLASLHSDHAQKEGNQVCTFCDGSGRNWGPQGKGTGQFRCSYCNGTGFKGSY